MCKSKVSPHYVKSVLLRNTGGFLCQSLTVTQVTATNCHSYTKAKCYDKCAIYAMVCQFTHEQILLNVNHSVKDEKCHLLRSKVGTFIKSDDHSRKNTKTSNVTTTQYIQYFIPIPVCQTSSKCSRQNWFLFRLSTN